MQEIARPEDPDEIPECQKTDMGRIIVIVDAVRRRMGDQDIQSPAGLDPVKKQPGQEG